MYAVTGITRRIGGVAGRTLLNAGLSVRAVVRDAAKSTGWKERGSEVALADMNDAPARSEHGHRRVAGSRGRGRRSALTSVHVRRCGRSDLSASDSRGSNVGFLVNSVFGSDRISRASKE
jgi:hypothetical protein